MPDSRGKTNTEEALRLLEHAIEAMHEIQAMVSGKKPTKAERLKAYRKLAGVQSACAVLQIALDPW